MRRISSIALLSLVFSQVLGRPAPVQADVEDDACVAQLSDAEVELRLAFVEHSLEKQRAGAIAWWTGWTSFNLANVGAGIGVLTLSHKRIVRDSWIMAVIGAGTFVVQASVLPMPGIYASRRLARLSAVTPVQRREKLRAGLRLLDKAASIENTNSNWVAQVAGLAYAAASSGYVWAHNRHAAPHLLALVVSLQFSSTVAFAEFTFWTVPRKARRDQALLRKSACGVGRSGPEPAGARAAPIEQGLRSLGLRFFPGEVALTARF